MQKTGRSSTHRSQGLLRIPLRKKTRSGRNHRKTQQTLQQPERTQKHTPDSPGQTRNLIPRAWNPDNLCRHLRLLRNMRGIGRPCRLHARTKLRKPHVPGPRRSRHLLRRHRHRPKHRILPERSLHTIP